MKPGHIRVFDGLRITTEHMEHLQDSFHSAVQDLRQILGLGLVHTGFEVTPDGESGILIMPGIAFDFQKNRIVSDVPKKQPISLAAETSPQFVCLQYSQVESGSVEGKPTLIWDSCSIVVRASLPEPDQNLIPIAKLDLDEQGKLRITRLPEINQQEQAVETAEQSVVEETEVSGMAEVSPLAEASELAGSNPQPAVEEPASPESESQPSTGEQTAGESMPAATPSSPGSARHLVVRQGVIRPGDNLSGRNDLGTTLLEPLRRTLLRSNGVAGNGVNTRLFIPLVEKELSFDFPVASLSTQAVMNGSLERGQPRMAGAMEENQAGQLTRTFQVVAQGEATLCIATNLTENRGQVPQSGLSRTILRPETGLAEIVRLTDGWILEFPFQAVLETVTQDSLRTELDVLRHISLVMSLKQGEGQNLKLSLELVWEGGVDETIMKWLETHPTQFSWEAHLAWKAVSESQ